MRNRKLSYRFDVFRFQWIFFYHSISLFIPIFIFCIYLSFNFDISSTLWFFSLFYDCADWLIVLPLPNIPFAFPLAICILTGTPPPNPPTFSFFLSFFFFLPFLYQSFFLSLAFSPPAASHIPLWLEKPAEIFAFSSRICKSLLLLLLLLFFLHFLLLLHFLLQENELRWEIMWLWSWLPGLFLLYCFWCLFSFSPSLFFCLFVSLFFFFFSLFLFLSLSLFLFLTLSLSSFSLLLSTLFLSLAFFHTYFLDFFFVLFFSFTFSFWFLVLALESQWKDIPFFSLLYNNSLLFLVFRSFSWFFCKFSYSFFLQ